MTWKTIWVSKAREGYTRSTKAWLKVAIREGIVVNGELFFEKETRHRTYIESVTVSPQELLDLCVALEPIHTKLLQEIAKK